MISSQADSLGSAQADTDIKANTQHSSGTCEMGFCLPRTTPLISSYLTQMGHLVTYKAPH